MKINLIWAQARNGVIGKNGALPWHLPEDLAHFKRCTHGHPVIMGRKTWDSLPPRVKPLPGRLNIVLSRQGTDMPPPPPHAPDTGAMVCPNLADAIQFCKQRKFGEVWVIGGGEIYAQALTVAHTVVVTHIDAELDGDTFAPTLDANWHPSASSKQLAANGMLFSWVTYKQGDH